MYFLQENNRFLHRSPFFLQELPSSLRKYKIQGDGMVSEEGQGIKQPPEGKNQSPEGDDKDAG